MRVRHGLPASISVEPPFEHPVRLALFGRDEADGIITDPLGRLVGFDAGGEPVFILVHLNGTDLLDCLRINHICLHAPGIGSLLVCDYT